MRHILNNFGYFLKEAKRIIGLNRLASTFSFISTGLILFILALVISCWGISTQLIKTLQGEAEISAYIDSGIDAGDVYRLIDIIKDIDGVQDARLIGQNEARERMEAILGDEARVLELFDENPFEAFIEVRVPLDEIEGVAERIRGLKGIDYVRENKEVLGRVQNIAGGLKKLGYLVIIAVGISTLVIVSHIIRQGIYDNRVQISALRLLGAPDSFIGFPFVLAGLLLTLAGGLVASVFIVFLINQAYNGIVVSLPFIPLPPQGLLISGLVVLTIMISILLGTLGSLFGLSSIK